MTYLGAPAIAAAVHVKPGTVYDWAKAQRRGERIPLNLRRTASGRLWCDSQDIYGFFNPPDPGVDTVGAEVAAHLARQRAHSREGRCSHAGRPLKAPETNNRNREKAICQGMCEAHENQGAPSLGSALVLQK